MGKLVDKHKLSKGSKGVAKRPAAKQINSAFSKVHGLAYSSPSDPRAVTNVSLKRLQQPSYEEMIKKSDAEAKKFFEKARVIGPLPKGTIIKCWLCSSAMVVSGKEARCCNKDSLCIRPRIYDINLAFSPFYMQRSAGHKISYAEFLRTAYSWGCKLPNDSAVHMVRHPSTSVRNAESHVSRHYDNIKLAMAYSEMELAQKQTFSSDIVEPDSGRTGSKKLSSDLTSHTGRTLVLKGRMSKQWVAVPLRSRTTKRGARGGGGPETEEEVKKPLRRALGVATVAAPDGGKGLGKGIRAAQKPILTGVSHGQKIFTPTAKLLKSKLDAATIEFLRKGTCTEPPTVKETARLFYLAAGDNGAESTIGTIKNTMRRFGNSGRNKSRNPTRKNTESLAAAASTRVSGLQHVIDGLSSFRVAGLSGALKLSPTEAFDMKKTWWLFKHE